MAEGWKWSWNEPGYLHHYVLEHADRELGRVGTRKTPLEYRNQGDLNGLIQEIYEALHDPPGGRGGPYAGSEFQDIRSAYEVLRKTNLGTCIDLSLLFCGLCLDYDLVPLLVLLDGHAFAAVSLRYTRTAYRGEQPKRDLRELRDRFNAYDPLFKDGAWLREQVAQNEWLAVECTGFASWKPLAPDSGPPEARNRDADGYLSFDDASRAGEAQLQPEPAGQPNARTLICIQNTAHARDIWRIKADEAGLPPVRPAVQTVPLNLAALVDRETYADRIKNVVKITGAGLYVLILHGDRRQAHDAFIARIALWDLPRLFNTRTVVVSKLRPPLSPVSDVDAFMLPQLAPLWNRDEEEGWLPLLDRIKAEPPQILQFNFLFGEETPGQTLGFEVVKWTLDCWRDWASQHAASVAGRLIIVLSVAYDPSDDLTDPPGRKKWKRKFKPPPGSGIRPKVEEIKIDDYKPSLYVDRMDALPGVSWKNLDEWINRTEVEDYFRQALPGLRQEVETALRDECARHDQSLPMRTVIETLVKLTVPDSGGPSP
jgi:hypothetical protein